MIFGYVEVQPKRENTQSSSICGHRADFNNQRAKTKKKPPPSVSQRKILRGIKKTPKHLKRIPNPNIKNKIVSTPTTAAKIDFINHPF